MNAAVRYRRMQGLSLVEVMVSLVIGLVVVGAVLVSYFAAGVTGRQQAAYAEINENAQLALTLIARDLLLAGSATPTGVAAGGLSFTRTYAGRPVFGCSTGFETPAIKGDVACAASPRVVVRYLRAGAVSDWGRVISVRVCLLMRSSEAVLGSAEDTLTYLDCDSEQQTAADGHVRRAYFSTTTLRNKMAF